MHGDIKHAMALVNFLRNVDFVRACVEAVKLCFIANTRSVRRRHVSELFKNNEISRPSLILGV